MSIPIPIAERYIGQQPTIDALHAALERVSVDTDHCHVLYLEGGGGQGKTFFLRQVPSLVDQQPAFIARIIDLADTQNRNGAFLEQTIIDGLRADTDQPYRLAPDVLQPAFTGYYELREQLERDRDRLVGPAFDTRLAEVRAAFAEAMNQIALQRPVILRFDTAESLTGEPPEPELQELLASARRNASVELRFPSALDLFFAWFSAVVPRLRRVLVLICGRPVPADWPDATLVGRCARLAQVTMQRLTLHPLNQQEIAEYLTDALPTFTPPQIDEAHRVSGGAPLLVASYVWLHMTSRQPTFTPGNRNDFERHLITQVLNPIMPWASFPIKVLAYCLYVLAYARRGLTREQLEAFLAEQDLPAPHESFTNEERQQYADLIAHLGEVALVKERPQSGLLYLHDEVHRMIDEWQIADRMGLRGETLRYLRDLAVREHENRLRVPAAEPAERAALLVAISNRIFYELELDLSTGYTEYLLAQLRLFNNREYELPLLLRDEFWRWINLRASDSETEGRSYQPRRDQLTDAPPSQLHLKHLLADDLLWLLRHDLARNENQKVVVLGRQALSDFLPQYSDDAYFYYDLKQIVAHALTLYHNQEVLYTGAEGHFHEALQIAQRVLEEPAGLPRQRFFRAYIKYFLGRTRTLLGYMYRTVQEFERAYAEYQVAYQNFQEFWNEGEPARVALYLPVSDEMAQIRINQVYVLAYLGDFDEAERLLIELRTAIRHGQISPVRQALIFNVSSILETQRNRPEAAEAFAKRARRLAASTGNQRVLAQVNYQLGIASHELLKHPPYLVDLSAEEYFRAAADFFRSANERTSLCDVLLDNARYLRTLAHNEGRKPNPDRVRMNDLLDRAQHLLDQADEAVSGDPPAGHITLPGVEIAVERAFILRLQHQRADALRVLDEAEDRIRRHRLPRRALLMSATIAFERAWHKAQEHQPREFLQYLLISLVHCRIYARNDRTYLRFWEIIRGDLNSYPPAFLANAQHILDHADHELPASRPALMVGPLDPDTFQRYEEQWPGFWNEERQLLQNEVEIQLSRLG